MPVTVVGSANMDLVVRCGRIPKPGETVAGTTFETVPGGKGANQAAAIARLGGSVRFIGKVGEDGFGSELLSSLRGYGVDISLVGRAAAAPTGVALIQVDQDGQNTIVVVPGANGKLSPDEVMRALPGEQRQVLLLQGEIPLGTIRAALQGWKGLRILNPAPVIDNVASLFPLVDILTPNESECEALTGVSPVDDEACARACKALSVDRVVLTLGDRGSFAWQQGAGRLLPAYQVTPVDTTAAGDAFNGALAHFLSEGKSLDKAVQMANAVGALSTTKRGAQPSMPSLDELHSFLRSA